MGVYLVVGNGAIRIDVGINISYLHSIVDPFALIIYPPFDLPLDLSFMGRISSCSNWK